VQGGESGWHGNQNTMAWDCYTKPSN